MRRSFPYVMFGEIIYEAVLDMAEGQVLGTTAGEILSKTEQVLDAMRHEVEQFDFDAYNISRPTDADLQKALDHARRRAAS